MPTVLDSTVVGSALDTSGNGGRRLTRLTNGHIIALLNDPGVGFKTYRSINNGSSFSLWKASNNTTMGSMAIANIGNYMYILVAQSNGLLRCFSYDEAGTLISTQDIDNQSSYGNVTMVAHGNDLHIGVASKNTSYPNSFNIRYNKATISSSGVPTWGSVEQWTKENTNSNTDVKNPTIAIQNGEPIIFVESNIRFSSGAYPSYTIIALSNKANWANTRNGIKYVEVYSGGSYAQSSPSAIFVPQSVNGLANGRIWVAWHGTDSTDTVADNLRVAYSDDGGITWTVVKVTTGNVNYQRNATITANKSNQIFVLFEHYDGANYQVGKIANLTGTWGSRTVIGSMTGNVTEANRPKPSALFDLTVNFTEPLFIYKNYSASKVGFYGTWTSTSISVTPGDIGQKTDKANLLTYSITTDGSMSVITEKVNGVTVGTKNAASGQSLTVGLTQEQWDAVRFGKYGSGFNNTLSNVVADWEQGTWTGTLVGSTPSKTDSTTTIRLKSPLVLQKNTQYSFVVQAGYEALVFELNSSGVVTLNTGWMLNGTTFTTTKDLASAQVVLKKSGTPTPTITPTDVSSALPSITERFIDNTLTIEMGSEKWTYTFDKRPATDADIISATKAHKDIAEVVDPARRAKMANAIRSKGGSALDSDAWETMAQAVEGITVIKKASGSVTGSSSQLSFTQYSGSTSNYYYVEVTGLTVKPSFIIVRRPADPMFQCVYDFGETNTNYLIKMTYTNTSTFYFKVDGTNAYVTDTGFRLPVTNAVSSGSYTWMIVE